MEYDDLFLFPSFIFDELEKHKELILRKSKMDKENFNKLLDILLKKVMIVPEEVLFIYRKKAIELTKDIDINDALFIACALAYSHSIIWSDDAALKKVKDVNVFNTSEIIEVIGRS